LSTAVYVGKDVGITLQIPVEREPHKIPDVSPYTITLLNTPISDRDMDGVSDEVSHITVVDKNGNTVTPVSVDDSTGQVTFDAVDAGKTVYVTYRFDSAPYVAQELSLEPKQRIEGLDGLGSDIIQVWAVLQKEISGLIKEAFQHGNTEQLARTGLPKVFYENFLNADRWEPLEYGTWEVTSDKKYHMDQTFPATFTASLIKGWRLKDFYAKFEVSVNDADVYTGMYLRYQDSWNWYLFGVNAAQDVVVFAKRVNNTFSTIATYTTTIDPNTTYSLEVLIKENGFKGIFEGDIVLETSDTDIQSTGRIGLGGDGAGYGQAWFDNLRIYSPPLRSGEYGIIVSWDQAGSAVKIGLDGVVFSEGSILTPKDEPVYVDSPFRARSIKVIT